ncbi:MAG: type I-C CRISPR-associated protein Cas7/Csd2 [Bacteroidetes bacterium]|nr:type I-C CRISPR-associated protein Cas7/Csd2 [Bacteroidota bacterium]MCL5737204.1 type I-C CRISPR-associated protein Cas7/Csd2 [Bacteroidota bacterium]
MSDPIKNRYDFVFLFDVKDGNPNGDPDQDNLPRVDAENQEGLVTDVCMKRKVRNYIQTVRKDIPGFGIFIRQRSVDEEYPYLNKEIESSGDSVQEKKKSLIEKYYDIRTFGAVLSTGKENKAAEDTDNDEGKKEKKSKEKKAKGAGTVRGPVQFTFARSIDRIFQADHSITRCAVTTEGEFIDHKEKMEFPSTMGRKSTVPYALYEMHGFVSAVDAVKTRFSEDDLSLLWEGLINAFEHDRSAARGEMNPRKLIVFKHESHLGNARAGELFERVKVEKKKDVVLPRAWIDYEVTVQKSDLPKGVSVEEKL